MRWPMRCAATTTSRSRARRPRLHEALAAAVDPLSPGRAPRLAAAAAAPAARRRQRAGRGAARIARPRHRCARPRDRRADPQHRAGLRRRRRGRALGLLRLAAGLTAGAPRAHKVTSIRGLRAPFVVSERCRLRRQSRPENRTEEQGWRGPSGRSDPSGTRHPALRRTRRVVVGSPVDHIPQSSIAHRAPRERPAQRWACAVPPASGLPSVVPCSWVATLVFVHAVPAAGRCRDRTLGRTLRERRRTGPVVGQTR